ncbi:MAG: hypothetical protein LBE57_06285 [Methanosarcinales archaeon]|jgi:hypothetical protein|nr:hypothetical protein [Methanosarcinales archaeon]
MEKSISEEINEVLSFYTPGNINVSSLKNERDFKNYACNAYGVLFNLLNKTLRIDDLYINRTDEKTVIILGLLRKIEEIMYSYMKIILVEDYEGDA